MNLKYKNSTILHYHILSYIQYLKYSTISIKFHTHIQIERNQKPKRDATESAWRENTHLKIFAADTLLSNITHTNHTKTSENVKRFNALEKKTQHAIGDRFPWHDRRHLFLRRLMAIIVKNLTLKAFSEQ